LYREKFFLSIVVVLCGLSLAFIITEMTIYRQRFQPKFSKTPVEKSVIPINKAILNAFEKYPDLKNSNPILNLYKNRNYNSIWYDKKGLIEFADLLYSKVNV
jgi:hypothetical protein